MEDKPVSWRRLRFWASFTLLSILTLLLVAFTFYFIFQTPVWAQMGVWARQELVTIPPTGGQPATASSEEETPVEAASEAVTAFVEQAGAPVPVERADAQIPETGAAQGGAVETVNHPAPAGASPAPLTVYQVIEPTPPDGRLLIPALDLDLPLTPVAVRGDEWDLSALGAQVGWLETTGAHPGGDLAMVFIGHITLPPPGGPGPFLKLRSLKNGDEVAYRTARETYIYTITGQQIVTPDKVESLYHSDGRRLLLVTCSGYNALQRKFDRRLLVEAELTRIEQAAAPLAE